MKQAYNISHTFTGRQYNVTKVLERSACLHCNVCTKHT